MKDELKLQSFKIMKQLLLLLSQLIFIYTFEFSPPSVTAIPLTINTLSVYQITIDRAYTQDLIQTHWNSQLVPLTSNITIIFPAQYSFNSSNQPHLDSIFIDGQPSISPVLIRINSQTLIINNFITTDLAINTIVITISNVLNPSPAFTTSTFQVKIGNDFSSINGDSNSIITLIPDQFIYCGVNFSPAITNTTGDMVLLITPKTPIPITGYLIIQFPTNLQWSEDVSSNHPLQVDKVTNCSITSTQVNSIDCLGSKSYHKITINFHSSTSLAITYNFTITIKGLFSPPTVNPPDQLKFSSFTFQTYGLDTCSSKILNLQPQSLSLIIDSTSIPLYIDSLTTLSFNFTNTDTISRDDYFQTVFPSPTTISFNRSMSNLALANGTYNSTILTIRYNPLASAINVNSLTNNYIKFLNYRSPLTTKQTEFIYLTIYSAGGRKKMEGKSKVKAQQRSYNILTQNANSLFINELTSYFLTINIQNTVTSKAMLKIVFPSELQITNLTVCPHLYNVSGTNNSCTLSLLGSQYVILSKNIWSSAPIGQQKIQLPQILNPGYSTNISQFKVYLYYNQSEDYIVADYTSILTDNLTILPKKINPLNVNISLSDYKVASANVSYTINFEVENDLLANGIIDLYMPINPSFILTPGTSFECLFSYGNIIETAKNCSYNTTQKSIRIFIVQAVPAYNSIKIKLKDCCTNPYNTRPISFIAIQTLTSTFNMIQYLQNSIYITGFISIPIKSQFIIRGSDTNSQSNVWTLNFQQYQLIDQNINSIQIYFPLWSALNDLTSIKISNLDQVQNINFTISNSNKNLTFFIPNQLIKYKQYILTLSSIINPYTFEPLTYQITTKTVDNYFYATSNFTLPPTLMASGFNSFSHKFGSKILGTYSNLTITLQNRADNAGIIEKFVLYNLSQYTEGNSTIECQNNTIYICSISSDKSILTIILSNSSLIFPSPFVITLSNLYIRLSMNFINMSLSSYSFTGFKASEYKSIDFGPLCNLPCKQCQSETQLSKCTSCFDISTISLQKYLLNSTCYQTCLNGTYEYFDINLTSYQYICANCSIQCLTCDIISTNCTGCNSSSLYKYSYQNYCLQICPNLTYPIMQTTNDYTCKNCTSPCLTCNSLTNCTSCLSNYFFYLNNCISNCPINTTIPNLTTKTCDNCSKECKICQNQTTNCLQCATVGNITYLFLKDLYQCVNICPVYRVIDKTFKQCVYCEAPCQTCFAVQNNCTSCLNNTFLSIINPNNCVTTCQILSYKNQTSNKCQLCSTITQLNCRNCSSSTSCYECDKHTLYVFFPVNFSCLSTVPLGYVNISGLAVKCDIACKQCTQIPTKCTMCNTGLFLLNNICTASCGNGFISANGTCLPCQSGCQLCSLSVTNCTKCLNIYYFVNNTLTNQQNQCVIQCPLGSFYSSFNISEANKMCIACQAPCKYCQNLTYCLSCISGFAYNGQCYEICPNTTVSNTDQMICQDCISPCQQCQLYTYVCTVCIDIYYLFQSFNRCYLPSQCPFNISISNAATKLCQACQQPCLNCINATNKCLSCVAQSLLFKQNFQCVTQCPSGYYQSSGQCKACLIQCSECINSFNCTKCSSGFLFYDFQCLSACPSNYSIVINKTCTKCKEWCLNCSNNNYCYECDSSTILLQGQCLTSCLPGLIYFYNTSTNKRSCLTSQQAATIQLTTVLSGTSFSQIFPLPFLIISSIFFIASIMSKIQYQDTYIFGWAYVVYGLAEVSCLGYFFYKFWFMKFNHDQQLTTNADLKYDLLSKLLIGCLGLIGCLNFFACTCGSYQLSEDKQFANWMSIKKNKHKKHTNQYKQYHQSQKVMNASQSSISDETQTAQQNQQNQKNSLEQSEKICCQPMTTFLLTSIFSLITIFKFRFILFTRLFDLIFFSAKLQNVQKFRFFNILTFIGFFYQGVGIFVMYKILTEYEKKYQGELLFQAIDCTSLLIINGIVGIISMNKGEDFFQQKIKQNEIDKQIVDKSFTKHPDNDDPLGSKRKLIQSDKKIRSKNSIANLYNLNISSPNKNTKSLTSPSKNIKNSQQDSRKSPELIQNKKLNSIFQVQKGNLIPIKPIIEDQNQENSYSLINQTKFVGKKSSAINNVNEMDPIFKLKKVVSILEENDQINNPYLQAKGKNSSPNNQSKKDNQFKLQNTKVKLRKKRKSIKHNIRSSTKQVDLNQRPEYPITSQDWRPKIKQTHLKRQSLSHMDLIDLYNPQIDIMQQFKKSSSQFVLPSKQIQIDNYLPKTYSNKQQGFIRNPIGLLNKISQQKQSAQLSQELQNNLQQNNNDFYNKTFEQGKIYSSNNQNAKQQKQIHENQKNMNLNHYQNNINNYEQQSFENILPFVHIEETNEFVKRDLNKKIQKKSRNNKRQVFRNGNKQIQQLKVRNIFDHSENDDNQSDDI